VSAGLTALGLTPVSFCLISGWVGQAIPLDNAWHYDGVPLIEWGCSTILVSPVTFLFAGFVAAIPAKLFARDTAALKAAGKVDAVGLLVGILIGLIIGGLVPVLFTTVVLHPELFGNQ
jgi:hypothetical protein